MSHRSTEILGGREDGGGQADGAHAGTAQAGHGRECRATLHRPADELEVFFGMPGDRGHFRSLARATRHVAKVAHVWIAVKELRATNHTVAAR